MKYRHDVALALSVWCSFRLTDGIRELLRKSYVKTVSRTELHRFRDLSEEDARTLMEWLRELDPGANQTFEVLAIGGTQGEREHFSNDGSMDRLSVGEVPFFDNEPMEDNRL